MPQDTVYHFLTHMQNISILQEQLLHGYFSCDCLKTHVAQFEQHLSVVSSSWKSWYNGLHAAFWPHVNNVWTKCVQSSKVAGDVRTTLSQRGGQLWVLIECIDGNYNPILSTARLLMMATRQSNHNSWIVAAGRLRWGGWTQKLPVIWHLSKQLE